jgi:GNAT superfamily N-acetyltransferase
MSNRFNIQVTDAGQSVADAAIAAVADLWNSALAPELAISNAFVRYNLQPSAGVERCLLVAFEDEQTVGMAIATALHGEPSVNAQGEGWIDALVVAPEVQRHGLGRQLLDGTERWLAAQGCRAIQIGGGLRPFAPGAPESSDAAPFFERQGYTLLGTAWDVSANLATYSSPPEVSEAPCAVRPATASQVADLLGFLRREFPGRWRYEAEMFLADGGRISDFMLLWTERGVDGCCLLTFPDSIRPIERFYPYHLPKPWGQLGSIGISADRRGQGFGAALLDSSLRRLHDNGVNGCVIDWTTLIDFYGKFGFERYRAYTMLGRTT